MREMLRRGLSAISFPCPISEDAAEKLSRYGELLLEKNHVMNLTAITDPIGVAQLHMLDCAALGAFIDFSGKHLIDVGTGAGFPGLVLKILFPSLHVTLLDSLRKRLLWLEEVCRELSLKDVSILHARAEDAGHDITLRESFDFATARAVAALPLLCELCLPFVKRGGSFLAMKSISSDEELAKAQNAIHRLGGQLYRQEEYEIPGTEIRHRLVEMKKECVTPASYPRTFAKMKKMPLS